MIHWDGSDLWSRTGGPICPDLACLSYFGEADNLRGRIVRAFFHVLDTLWPVSND